VMLICMVDAQFIGQTKYGECKPSELSRARQRGGSRKQRNEAVLASKTTRQFSRAGQRGGPREQGNEACMATKNLDRTLERKLTRGQ
jgi:hypothetical protein